MLVGIVGGACSLVAVVTSHGVSRGDDVTDDERRQRRSEAVRQVIEEGRSQSDIARQLGIPRQSVSRWVASHKRRERAKMPLPSLLDAVAVRCARMLVDAEEYGTAERNAAIVMGIAVDKRRVLADERATSTDHNVALRWLKGEAARVLSANGATDVVALVEEREPNPSACAQPDAVGSSAGADSSPASLQFAQDPTSTGAGSRAGRGDPHAAEETGVGIDPDTQKYLAQ